MSLFTLEEFRRAVGYHPFHFWGLGGLKAPVSSSCNDTVAEYAWQHADYVGRREILNAIEISEDKLKNYLGYSIAPHYVEEVHEFPHMTSPLFERYGYADSGGKWITVTAKEGKIFDGGVEKIDDIGETSVTYSDSDGDGLNDVFTATIATTVTDPDEIMASFTISDRPEGESLFGDKSWEIAPISVSIAAGIATIKGRIWQIVKPILYQGVSPDESIDAAGSVYVSNILVSHRYLYAGITTDDAQALLIWETRPYPSYVTLTPTIQYAADPNAVAVELARVVVRNADAGILGVGLARYDTDSAQWVHDPFEVLRPPDRIVIRYKAGVKRVNGLVDPLYSPCVFRMAAAEMTRPICACELANKELYNWQFDLARSSGAMDEAYGAISRDDLANPFGTRRGHISAWKTVKQMRLITGFSI
jgi:hypothetical protein